MLQLPFLRRYIGRFDLQDLDDINKKNAPRGVFLILGLILILTPARRA